MLGQPYTIALELELPASPENQVGGGSGSTLSVRSTVLHSGAGDVHVLPGNVRETRRTIISLLSVQSSRVQVCRAFLLLFLPFIQSTSHQDLFVGRHC